MPRQTVHKLSAAADEGGSAYFVGKEEEAMINLLTEMAQRTARKCALAVLFVLAMALAARVPAKPLSYNGFDPVPRTDQS